MQTPSRGKLVLSRPKAHICLRPKGKTVFSIFTGDEPPRVPKEVESYLANSSAYRKGDWFLGPDYTVIRPYGSEIAPYKLPKLLTPRIFIL